jgi:hypothetical protein
MAVRAGLLSNFRGGLRFRFLARRSRHILYDGKRKMKPPGNGRSQDRRQEPHRLNATVSFISADQSNGGMTKMAHFHASPKARLVARVSLPLILGWSRDVHGRDIDLHIFRGPFVAVPALGLAGDGGSSLVQFQAPGGCQSVGRRKSNEWASIRLSSYVGRMMIQLAPFEAAVGVNLATSLSSRHTSNGPSVSLSDISWRTCLSSSAQIACGGPALRFSSSIG